MNLPYAIMAFVTLQRLSELVIAKRNTARLMAAGAREYGASHYPVMVAMHTAWLLALWVSVGDRTVAWPLCWSSRCCKPCVSGCWRRWGRGGRRGSSSCPARRSSPGGRSGFLRHPNYAVVTAEIAVLPLTFGLIGIAALFTVLNAAMLYVRIARRTARSVSAPGRRRLPLGLDPQHRGVTDGEV